MTEASAIFAPLNEKSREDFFNDVNTAYQYLDKINVGNLGNISLVSDLFCVNNEDASERISNFKDLNLENLNLDTPKTQCELYTTAEDSRVHPRDSKEHSISDKADEYCNTKVKKKKFHVLPIRYFKMHNTSGSNKLRWTNFLMWSKKDIKELRESKCTKTIQMGSEDSISRKKGVRGSWHKSWYRGIFGSLRLNSYRVGVEPQDHRRHSTITSQSTPQQPTAPSDTQSVSASKPEEEDKDMNIEVPNLLNPSSDEVKGVSIPLKENAINNKVRFIREKSDDSIIIVNKGKFSKKKRSLSTSPGSLKSKGKSKELEGPYRSSTSHCEKGRNPNFSSCGAKATLSLVWSCKGLSNIPIDGIKGVRSTLITQIHLNNNGLSSIPPDFFELTPNLVYLDLSDNFLTSIEIGPSAVINKLKSLEVKKNLLTKFSIRRDGMPDLSHIDLSDNQIKDIPENIFIPERIRKLNYVNLSNNRISIISPDVAIFILDPEPKILKLNLNPLKSNSEVVIMKEASKRASQSLVNHLVQHFPNLKENLRTNLITKAAKFTKTTNDDFDGVSLSSKPKDDSPKSATKLSPASLKAQEEILSNSIPKEITAVCLDSTSSSAHDETPTVILKVASRHSPTSSSNCHSGSSLEFPYNIKLDSIIGNIYSYLLTWWLCSLKMDSYLLRSASYHEEQELVNKRVNYVSSLFFGAWDFCVPSYVPCGSYAHKSATKSCDSRTCTRTVNNAMNPNSLNINPESVDPPDVAVNGLTDTTYSSLKRTSSCNSGYGSDQHLNSGCCYVTTQPRAALIKDNSSNENVDHKTRENLNVYTDAHNSSGLNKSTEVLQNSDVDNSKDDIQDSVASKGNCDIIQVAAGIVENEIQDDACKTEKPDEPLASNKLDTSSKRPSSSSYKSPESTPHPRVILEHRIKNISCKPVCSLACHNCNNSSKLSGKFEKMSLETLNLSKSYCKWIDLTSELLKSELHYVTQLKGLSSFLKSKISLGTRISPVCNMILYLIDDVVSFHLHHLLPRFPSIIEYVNNYSDNLGLGKLFSEIVPDLRQIYSIYSTNHESVLDLINSLNKRVQISLEGINLSPCSFSPYCEDTIGKNIVEDSKLFTWKGIFYTTERSVIPIYICLDTLGLAEWRFWSDEQSLSISGNQNELLSLLNLPKTRLQEYISAISSFRSALEFIPGSGSYVQGLDNSTSMLKDCIGHCQNAVSLGLLMTYCWKLLSGFCTEYKPYGFLDPHNDDISNYSIHVDEIRSYIESGDLPEMAISVEEALCVVAFLSNLNIIGLTETGSSFYNPENETNSSLVGNKSTSASKKTKENKYCSNSKKNWDRDASFHLNNQDLDSTDSDDDTYKIPKGFEFLAQYPVACNIYPQLPILSNKVILANVSDNTKYCRSAIVMYPFGYRRSPEDIHNFYEDNCENSAKIPNFLNISGILKSFNFSPNKSKSRSISKPPHNQYRTSSSRSEMSWVVTPYRIIWINTKTDLITREGSITEEICSRTWVYSFNISNTRISRVMVSPFPTKDSSKIARVWDDRISVHLWDLNDEVYSFLESILPSVSIIKPHLQLSKPTEIRKEFTSTPAPATPSA